MISLTHLFLLGLVFASTSAGQASVSLIDKLTLFGHETRQQCIRLLYSSSWADDDLEFKLNKFVETLAHFEVPGSRDEWRQWDEWSREALYLQVAERFKVYGPPEEPRQLNVRDANLSSMPSSIIKLFVNESAVFQLDELKLFPKLQVTLLKLRIAIARHTISLWIWQKGLRFNSILHLGPYDSDFVEGLEKGFREAFYGDRLTVTVLPFLPVADFAQLSVLRPKFLLRIEGHELLISNHESSQVAELAKFLEKLALRLSNRRDQLPFVATQEED